MTSPFLMAQQENAAPQAGPGPRTDPLKRHGPSVVVEFSVVHLERDGPGVELALRTHGRAARDEMRIP